MPAKRIAKLPPATQGRAKKSTCNLAGVSVASTPVKHQISVKTEMPTASTIGSSLTRSSFALPLSVTRSKISFMDMVAVDLKGDEEKCIKDFDGWLDTQYLVDAVKRISPDIS